MRTTDEALRGKVDSLPPTFADLVLSHEGTHAKVQSFTSKAVYDVSIQRVSDDELDVVCSCPATKVCKHIAAFYAVVKGISPEKAVSDEPDKETDKQDELTEPAPDAMTGRQMIAMAIEMLTDGIALVARDKK